MPSLNAIGRAIAVLAMLLSAGALTQSVAGERKYVPGQILIGFVDATTHEEATGHLRMLLDKFGHQDPFALRLMTPRAVRIDFETKPPGADTTADPNTNEEKFDMIKIAAFLSKDEKIAFAHPNWLAEGIPGNMSPSVTFGVQPPSPRGAKK